MSGSSSPAQGAQTGLHTSHVRFELRGQELKPDIVVSGLSHVRFELLFGQHVRFENQARFFRFVQLGRCRNSYRLA